MRAVTHGELPACLVPDWTCENVPWVGWGFMGITDKNSEVTLLLKCQSCKVWGAGFTLPGKVARAYRQETMPSQLQKTCSEAGKDTQSLSQVRQRFFTGWSKAIFGRQSGF